MVHHHHQKRIILCSFRHTLRQQFLRFQSQIAENSRNQPVEREPYRGLKVAVIGCPNAGKSALTNHLIRADLCAVSSKIDTTRQNMTTALTEKMSATDPTSSTCQLVLIDSPGLIGLKHAKKFVGVDSDARILADPEKAMERAEHIIVVQDATLPGKYLQHRILHLLYRYSHIPASLVLNKIDLIKKQSELLELAEILTKGCVDGVEVKKMVNSFGQLDDSSRRIKADEVEMRIHPSVDLSDKDEEWLKLYNNLLHKPAHKCNWNETRRLFLGETGWPNFKAVFFVSCLKGTGIDELRNYLKEMSSLNHSTLNFGGNVMSTENPRKVALEHVRSEMLNRLPGFIAYNLRPRLVEWQRQKSEFLGEKSTLNMITEVHFEKEKWAKKALRLVNEMESDLAKKFSKIFHANARLRILIKMSDGTLVTQIEDKEKRAEKSEDDDDEELEPKRGRKNVHNYT